MGFKTSLSTVGVKLLAYEAESVLNGASPVSSSAPRWGAKVLRQRLTAVILSVSLLHLLSETPASGPSVCHQVVN